MNVVIMGCGRVGSRLAGWLDREGHNVGIIDTNQAQFTRLGEHFGGTTVIGTGIDDDVLRAAGIERADAFVAVTEGDNRNIMAAQVARAVFGVPRVLARVYDPVRDEIFRGLGLDTICPTAIIARVFRDELAARPGVADGR